MKLKIILERLWKSYHKTGSFETMSSLLTEGGGDVERTPEKAATTKAAAETFQLFGGIKPHSVIPR